MHMQLKSYNTLRNEATCEYEIKRSRFIGFAKPVSTVQEAQEFVAGIRTLHRDARHNVYAYTVIDGDNRYTKYSDDGEPQGTAGLPLLNCLQKREIENAVLVVTRYFGGILLGAPGLLRAYTTSATMALDMCGIDTKTLCRRITVSADYRFISGLMNVFSASGLYPLSSEYTDKAVFTLLVEEEDIENLCYNIRELTSNNAEVEIGENEYK